MEPQEYCRIKCTPVAIFCISLFSGNCRLKWYDSSARLFLYFKQEKLYGITANTDFYLSLF